MSDRWSLAVHGGAGLIRRHSLTDERELACRAALHAALAAGARVLGAGGTAVDAVIEAVVILEDDPHFNAGRGSVLGADGRIEMDAALMVGPARAAGAATLIRGVRNPIRLARVVMEQTPHVLIAGAGARSLAERAGLALVDDAWLTVPDRVAQLEQARASGRFHLDHGGSDKDVYGTVGAVARAADGGLAAATSTGGMVNKQPGRIGDTPLVGAGTWADARCAVSATGHGERIILASLSSRVGSLMELGGLPLAEAAHHAIHTDLAGVDGAGGVIAVDAQGAIAMPFNTGGMFRGSVTDRSEATVAIW